MGRRYTLHRVVGQPNFTIGRDLGWLPGMLEDASTGESCLAARRPYEPPGFSTYEDGCLRELEKPAAMEGTGETDSVAEAEGFEPRVRARRDRPFETTLIDLRRLLVRGDSFPCQRDLEFESRSLRRSQRTSLPLRRCHPRQSDHPLPLMPARRSRQCPHSKMAASGTRAFRGITPPMLQALADRYFARHMLRWSRCGQ